MKFKLYRQFGALNSPEIFNAFENGLKKIGLGVSESPSAIPVIWSVLWHGRMKLNQQIYNEHISKNIPVVIIEVGNFARGITWRISVNNVNRLGHFGEGTIDNDRPKKLGISLRPLNQKRRSEILIACQHQNSLQWPNNVTIEEWVSKTVSQIRNLTSRRVYVRSHPRYPIKQFDKSITIEIPKKLAGTYDSFDFDHNYHVVVNYNTGPSVVSAINGTPIICDESGLAFPVSDSIENIENPRLQDREEWLIDLCHKEWTLEEIAQGIPQNRLVPYIESKIS